MNLRPLSEERWEKAGDRAGFTRHCATYFRQIAPQVTRIAVLYDPENPASTGYGAAIEAVAPSFAVQVLPRAVRDAAAVERAIEAFAGLRAFGRTSGL